jgi:cytochrome c oxidase subunit 2
MRRKVKLALTALSLLTLSVLLTGCEHFSSPQNTVAPAGTVAEEQKFDFLLVMWPALVVGLLVMFGLLFIAIRFRRKAGDPGLPKQIHGNTPLELAWTIIPALLMAAVAVPTLDGIRDLARSAEPGALQVHVEGQRFLWLFSYPGVLVGDQPLLGEPDELRIPVDREIALRITSVDVNHSFWVPKLAGKTDAIANHPNEMWMEATKTGTYEAQCAEFCGLEHSAMRFKVIVMPQDEFETWVSEQQQAALEDRDTDQASAGTE